MKGKGRAAKGASRSRTGLGGKYGKSKKRTPIEIQENEMEKLNKKNKEETREKDLAKQPHSFVIHRGAVGKYVKALEIDLRRIMEPNTAKHLKVRKVNNIKDFVVNGAVLGVTNMMVLTTSDDSVQLRMMRFSQGPTMSFKVKQYSISRHIVNAQKRPVTCKKFFQRSPLVVMNGFNQEGKKHLQLVQTFIQNMFPTLNIDTIDLRNVKRCLMVNYCAEDDTIELRHYALRVVASGLSKSSKKLLLAEKSSTKAIPDLSKYKDISEYFLNPGQMSDSEFEGEQAEVELAQDIHVKGGCIRGEKSNVRLIELGPRISLELTKIQEGIDEGEVLYHKHVQKTAQEIIATRKSAPLMKKMKKRREREEEQRVISRLKHVQERKEREEEEVKAIIEKAARKQAAATGQTEEVDTDRMKDREIAMNRERELQREENGEKPKFASRGRKRPTGEPLDYSRKKKAPNV